MYNIQYVKMYYVNPVILRFLTINHRRFTRTNSYSTQNENSYSILLSFIMMIESAFTLIVGVCLIYIIRKRNNPTIHCYSVLNVYKLFNQYFVLNKLWRHSNLLNWRKKVVGIWRMIYPLIHYYLVQLVEWISLKFKI